MKKPSKIFNQLKEHIIAKNNSMESTKEQKMLGDNENITWEARQPAQQQETPIPMDRSGELSPEGYKISQGDGNPLISEEKLQALSNSAKAESELDESGAKIDNSDTPIADPQEIKEIIASVNPSAEMPLEQ